MPECQHHCLDPMFEIVDCEVETDFFECARFMKEDTFRMAEAEIAVAEGYD